MNPPQSAHLFCISVSTLPPINSIKRLNVEMGAVETQEVLSWQSLKLEGLRSASGNGCWKCRVVWKGDLIRHVLIREMLKPSVRNARGCWNKVYWAEKCWFWYMLVMVSVLAKGFELRLVQKNGSPVHSFMFGKPRWRVWETQEWEAFTRLVYVWLAEDGKV